MKLFGVVAGLVAAAALATTTLAADAEIGMDAPPLKISHWVKGEPVELKDGKGKNIYVVEFWATWCGPCRRSIPHLTELQKKYADKNVVFVGITDEVDEVDAVKEFVKRQGDKMEYRVAVDAPDKDDSGGLTTKAYARAFSAPGIPVAFIVDKDGKIVYVGNPLAEEDQFDDSLAKIVSGDKYDSGPSKKRVAQFRKEEEAQRAAQRDNRELQELLQQWQTAATSSDGADKAKELAEKFVKQADKNAQALNALSWMMMTEEGVKHRDLDLAMKAARRAYDLTDGKDPAIVDTYARAHFEKGNVADAIKYQKQAIELCEKLPDEIKAQILPDLKEALKKYEGSRPKE